MSDQDQSERAALDAPGAALRERREELYPSALWQPSPNITRGRAGTVDRVVLHITDGQPRLERAVEHLCKPSSRVSAHFLIGQRGEIVQLVKLGDTAWHARGINGRSVGIEHIARTPRELGPEDAGLLLTDQQLAASARLVRWICEQLQLPLEPPYILPHCEVEGTTHRDCGLDVAEGGIWPWASYWARLRAA